MNDTALIVLMVLVTCVVARSQGRSALKWGLLALINPYVAAAVVLVLPPKGGRKPNQGKKKPAPADEAEQDDAQPQADADDTQPLPVLV